MLTLKTGDLAFYDGITGLHPCKVLQVTRSEIKVQFTTDSFYPPSTIAEVSRAHVVPRKAVSRRTAKMGRIMPYQIIED